MLLFQSLKSLRKKHTGDEMVSKAELRLRKDLQELTVDRLSARGTVTRINFPSKVHRKHLLNFMCTICPQQGPYAGGSFCFKLTVPENYPFSPPGVRCVDEVYHPNLHPQSGAVAMGILDEDWKPVLSMNTVIFGLQLLFLEPNYDEARIRNPEAAHLSRHNAPLFQQKVQRLIQAQKSRNMTGLVPRSNKRQYAHAPNSPELLKQKKRHRPCPESLSSFGRLSLSTSPQDPSMPPQDRTVDAGSSSSPSCNRIVEVGKKRSRSAFSATTMELDEPEPTRRKLDNDTGFHHSGSRSASDIPFESSSMVGSSSPVRRVVDDWNLAMRNTLHEGPLPLQPWSRHARSHSAPTGNVTDPMPRHGSQSTHTPSVRGSGPGPPATGDIYQRATEM